MEQLLARVPAHQLGVSVRDPEMGTAFAARGVRVRHGDFADPTSLEKAFEGARQVLIVSVDELGEVAVAKHAAAIEAARAAAARRILYTSHMGARPDSPFPPAPDHAATEALLRDSGVPFTSLRNGFYANTATMLVSQALQAGMLAAPEDGPVAWTAPADLAEAAARSPESPSRRTNIATRSSRTGPPSASQTCSSGCSKPADGATSPPPTRRSSDSSASRQPRSAKCSPTHPAAADDRHPDRVARRVLGRSRGPRG